MHNSLGIFVSMTFDYFDENRIWKNRSDSNRILQNTSSQSGAKTSETRPGSIRIPTNSELNFFLLMHFTTSSKINCHISYTHLYYLLVL